MCLISLPRTENNRSNKKSRCLAATACLCGAPGEIRTPDRLVRSQVLYPAELRARDIEGAHYPNAVRRSQQQSTRCWWFDGLLSIRSETARSKCIAANDTVHLAPGGTGGIVLVPKKNSKSTDLEQASVLVVEAADGDRKADLLLGRYPCLTAETAEAALQLIDTIRDVEQLGLVIVDHQLVGLDGLALIENLGKVLPEALKILVNDEEDVQFLLSAINQAHINYYLHAPCSENEFLLMVDHAMASFEYQSNRTAQIKQLEQCLADADAALETKQEELAQAMEMVEEVSLTDPLTGLRNRRYLAQHFDSDLSLVRRDYHGDAGGDHDVLFLLVAVDQFKAVNDIYGHSAGDRLLEGFTCRLRDVFRGSDLLVRWSTEEFLVVARFARRDGGGLIGQRLKEAVNAEMFEVGRGITLKKTCSIGFAAFPFFAHAPNELHWNRVVSFADRALVAAKAVGGNCWVGIEPRDGVDPNSAQRILSDPGHATRSGVAKVVTSLDDPSELVWN